MPGLRHHPPHRPLPAGEGLDRAFHAHVPAPPGRVVLRAEGADTPEKATAAATAHCDFWNATHLNEETGFVPDVLADRLAAEGGCRLRPIPDPRLLRLFLSQHVPRRVEGGNRIEYLGRKWTITPTRRQTVWLAIRPLDKGFYVLETRPDPTHPAIPPILGRYRF